MRILIVATKSPWPPQDGGRLALWLTMQGLADAGHELALIAPVDTTAQAAAESTRTALRRICHAELVVAQRRSWLASIATALRQRVAVTIARHRAPLVAAAVARCVDAWRPEVVHVEQLQALANCDAVRARRVPIVLRMQNIESAIWQQMARARWWSLPLLIEAGRLRRDETRALASVTRVITLTEGDAQALQACGGQGRRYEVTALAPPFPAELAAAPAIAGQPPVVLAGSAGWWPNDQALRWFADAVMPLLLAAQPGARAHIFGGSVISGAGIHCHPAPDDSTEAFPIGAIAAIPLQIGSGIRMRILEAWARGLPVVATSIAVRGLQAVSGRELLIADTALEFTQAISRLSDQPALRAALISAGHAYLAKHHPATELTSRLIAEYQWALRMKDPAP